MHICPLTTAMTIVLVSAVIDNHLPSMEMSPQYVTINEQINIKKRTLPLGALKTETVEVV